jgi:hypothetical protein
MAMSRVVSLDRRRGGVAGPVILTVAAFVVGVVVIFLVMMWGEGVGSQWGVLLAVFAPIAITILAVVLVTAQFVRARPWMVGQVGRAVRRELRAMFKTVPPS